MANQISQNELEAAIRRLDPVLSTQFRNEYIGRKRVEKLERIIGRSIGPDELLKLIVNQEGASLLAGRVSRVGKGTTSIRKKLLDALPEDRLRDLYTRVRGEEAPSQNGRIVNDLAGFKWHRGKTNAMAFARALGLPEQFAGTKEADKLPAVFEIEPWEQLPPLKPFQRGVLRELVECLRTHDRVMVSSFTGTGKTRMGMELAARILLKDEEPALVLWVAQKRELLDQACESMAVVWRWLAQESGEVLSTFRFMEGQSFDPDEITNRATMVVATAQQVVSRLKKGDAFLSAALQRARLLVIDEAHHAHASGHRAIIDAFVQARGSGGEAVVGLTATPGRSNILDPTESIQLAELFGRQLVVPAPPEEVPALDWFQKQGYLSKIQHRQVESKSQIPQTLGKLSKVTEPDNLGNYEFTDKFLDVYGADAQLNKTIAKQIKLLHEARRRTLVFCCNINQAELLHQALILSGIPCGVVHHRIDKRDRRTTLTRFRKGDLSTLLNVEVLTTGFDAPKIDTVLLCRPTMSRILYEQMVGRGLRGPQMGGTEYCDVIDFTTNLGRFQAPMAWEAFWREWAQDQPAEHARAQGEEWNVRQAEPIDDEA